MPRLCVTWKPRSRRHRVPAAKLRMPAGGRKIQALIAKVKKDME